MTKNNLKHVLILLFLSYIFFMLGNGVLGLTNPDEVFYTQTAKEMARHNSWMTPYLFDAPQFEKPIFLYWLLRMGFLIFGASSFSARFFPALFAALGVIAAYLLSLLAFGNEKKAFISSLVLMSCALFIGLARTLFTDLIFSVFILFSLCSFYWGYLRENRKSTAILLFFIFSALAVLTKGPLGFSMPFLIILAFLLIKKDMRFLFSKYFLWGLFIFCVISLPWYLLMFKKYGSSFWHEFFYNVHIRRFFEAEHPVNDKWYFYPFSMLGCMFPWSAYTLVSLIYLFKNLRRPANPIYIFLFCWIAIVFLTFQPAHSKLVSYIFPLFPALSTLTGDFIYNTVLPENKNRIFFNISLITLFILSLIPVGLTIAEFRYAGYIGSQSASYVLFFSSLIFPLLFCFLLFRYKFFKIIILLAFLIPALLFSSFFMVKDIEPYLSSRPLCDYLLKNYVVDNPIICGKSFVRGMRYYTDKEIAIFGTENFFSPHPISFLNYDEKIKDYLRRYSITYCVLKKPHVEYFRRRFTPEFKFTLLKVIGNAYLVRIEPGIAIN